MGLAGAPNARDIGGYATADGHRVKTGAVYRSNALNALTPEDIQALQGRKLAQVVDFRSAAERAAAPDVIIPGAAEVWAPLIANVPADSPGPTTREKGETLYKQLSSTSEARQELATFLRDILWGTGPTLYHCTSGKDRTGWATAVLLTILGVPRNVIASDYLLSNAHISGDDANHVDIRWLDAAFGEATAEYGSMTDYVQRGLGLTVEELDGLRHNLLQR